MSVTTLQVSADVSSSPPLRPGDLIATGTPGDVWAKRKPPLFMEVGDHEGATAGAVGHRTNAVAAKPKGR